MAIAFSADANAALQEFWVKGQEDLTFQNHQLMGVCSKKEESGRAVHFTVKYGYGSGKGTTATGANTNETGQKRAEFIVTPNSYYHEEDVDGLDALFSGGEGGAVDLVEDAVEGTTRGAGDALETYLFGSGGGAEGSIKSSTNPSGNIYVLTLNRPADAQNFGKDDKLVSKNGEFAGALDAGVATVLGIDIAAGTVRVDGGGTWTPTNGRVIGHQFVMAASTAATVWRGLAAWLPDVLNRPQAGENFYNVDRSLDSVRLAGHAVDARSFGSIRQAVNAVLTSISFISGARPDVVLMNPATLGKLINEIGDNAKSEELGGNGVELLYTGIKFLAQTGAIKVIGAPRCPADHLYVLDSSAVHLDAPNNQIIQNTAQNGSFIEHATADKSKVRARAAGFFYIDKPAYCGNALLTP